MDRPIVYPGSIPLDTDLLTTNQNVVKALGMMARATLGTSTTVDGLVCTQTTVPSMSVTVGQGSLTALTTVEPNAYGSLAADAVTPLMKMGINLAATSLGPMSAPATAGQSVVYLVQAAFSEADGTAVVLPYYNSGNPSVPYSGPANAGTAQNTKRAQTVTLGLKQGSAATTGSQTTPAADSGYVGLWAITIANGATTVVNANIAAVPGAPFLNATDGLGMKPGRLIGVRVITSSQVYVPTPGTNSVVVSIQAPGGGGGAVPSTSGSQIAVGGGGQAGAFAKGRFTSGFAGLTANPGAAGAGGAAGANSGTAGTTASFGGLMSVPAGGAGSGGSATIFAQTLFSGNGLTSAPTGGNIESICGGGSGPIVLMAASACLSGAGGASRMGAGGNAVATGFAGSASTNYGGGGSGACNGISGSALAGGNGGAGLIIIEEYT